MKKIINKKKYDTETAKLVKEFNFDCCEHRLYRKKSGEFFLHYHPFPILGGKDSFCILSDDFVKDWLEKYGSVDEYESLFGIVEE